MIRGLHARRSLVASRASGYVDTNGNHVPRQAGKTKKGVRMLSGKTVTSIQSETLAYWKKEVQKPEIIGIAKGKDDRFTDDQVPHQTPTRWAGA